MNKLQSAVPKLAGLLKPMTATPAPVLKLGAIVLLAAVGAFGQGIPVPLTPVTGSNGQPRPGATISVCAHPANAVPCTNYLQVYNDIAETQPINQSTNPLRTDGLGNPPAVYASPAIADYTISGTGIAAPNGPYVINIPLAASGNINFTGNITFNLLPSLPNQNANFLFAGPSSGPAAVPAFRSLAASDIPGGNACAANNFANALNAALSLSCAQVNFSNLAGSLALGQTPLSTLGDLLSVNSTPALARVAGNTSSTKNFLTQTGTGTVSALPVWGTIAATDVISGGFQGTDSKLMTAGTVSGTAATLCTDANGGATTSGCSSGGVTQATWAASYLPGGMTVANGASPCTSGLITSNCMKTLFAQAHTVVRVTGDLLISPAGCTTQPVVGIKDLTSGTVIGSITISNGQSANTMLDTGAISVSTTAGDIFGLGVLTAPAGCTTSPSFGSLTVIIQ